MRSFKLFARKPWQSWSRLVAALVTIVSTLAILTLVLRTDSATNVLVGALMRVHWYLGTSGSMLLLVVLMAASVLSTTHAARSRDLTVAPESDYVFGIPALVRRSISTQAIFAIVAWVGVSFIVGFARQRPLLAVMVEGTRMLFFLLFLDAMFSVVSYRVGEEIRCRTCGYLQAPIDQQPSLCPECGEEWHRANGTIRGHWRLHLGWTSYAVLMLFVVTLDGIGPFAIPGYSNAKISWLPTRTLIDEVTSPSRVRITGEWAALNKRTMSDSQQDYLATELLDLFDIRGCSDMPGERWLESQLAADALNEQLEQAWLDGLASYWIIGPDEVRVGEPIEIAIGSRSVGGFYLQNMAFLDFSGFDVPAMGITAHGRLDSLIGWGNLGQERWYLEIDRGPARSPTLTVVPEEAGSITVEATITTSLMTNPRTTVIERDQHGAPIYPVEPTALSSVTISKTIRVSP